MKQFELEQEKFPKLCVYVQQEPLITHNKKTKSKAHSEMLRIIIALLIAIFIFNSSQETTINYNEIIKNQKMFLVKNIRGVLPTLSGNLYKLQNNWKVVHFQNYHSNQSQIFNNFTLTFNKQTLLVTDPYCNITISYEWKNYSYNIDFKEIIHKAESRKAVSNQTPSIGNKQSQGAKNEGTTFFDPNKILQNQNTTSQSQVPGHGNETISVNNKTDLGNNVKKVSTNEEKEKQKVCEFSQNYFKQVFKFASIWTISDTNLYILLENTHLEEDFYMILQQPKLWL